MQPSVVLLSALGSNFESSPPRLAGTALQKASLLWLHDFVTSVTSLTVTHGNVQYSWEDVCQLAGAQCATFSVLEFFDNNRTLIASASEQSLLAMASVVDKVSVFGRTLRLEDVAAGVVRNATGFVTSVGVLHTTFPVQAVRPGQSSEREVATEMAIQFGELAQSSAIRVGAQVCDVVEGCMATLVRLMALVQAAGAQFSVDSEGQIVRDSSKDATNASSTCTSLLWLCTLRDCITQCLCCVPPDALGFGCLLFCTALLLTPWSRDWLRSPRQCALSSRFSLSLGLVFTLLLGLVTGCGFLAALGVTFDIVVVAIVPLIVVGIGVDDAFVCLATLDAQPHAMAGAERVATMMVKSIRGITITTFTTVAALSLGLRSDIPSVRSFCAYAASSMVAVWLYVFVFHCRVRVVHACFTPRRCVTLFATCLDTWSSCSPPWRPYTNASLPRTAVTCFAASA